MNRREFFTMTATGAAVVGANDRIGVGVIGTGSRGLDLVRTFLQQGCAITAVCDVDREALDRAVAETEKLQKSRPKAYSDLRHLLADREVDAVAIATPNHWHALATIWACQAGKDVYVEKPACHTVQEGSRMVEAARKYRRMVQTGTQSRSLAHKMQAVRMLREGAIGKVYFAKGICYKRRPSIGRTPQQAVPPGLDWDLFLGPARMRPFSANRFRYNWHWFWDTGSGDIGNQGAHEMDIARWGLGKDSLPHGVVSTGGKFVYDDDQETPNTQLATFDYGDAQLVFEVRGLPTGGEGAVRPMGQNIIGNLFYGSEGMMVVDLVGCRVFRGEKLEKVMEEGLRETNAWDTGPHVANFLQAMRTRNPNDLAADIEVGVLSATLCHLANISYRTGRRLKVDSARCGVVEDAEASRLLAREYRAPFVLPGEV